MTTSTTQKALPNLESAVEAIDQLTWDGADSEDKIGLEIEAFPIMDGPGYGARLPLHGPEGVLEIAEVGFSGSRISEPPDPPVFAIGDGARLSFEPGAQVELSTSAHHNTYSLMDEVDEAWNGLEEVLRHRSADLICLGLDPWHDIEEVPQQHKSGRYVAMDSYFSRRWAAGAEMMRNTCSLQLNLEAGRQETRRERWLAANLMSPILTAMFSTSPGPRGIANRRAEIWQSIDLTRTGYPDWRIFDQVDPLEDTRRRALEANVIFVVRNGRFHTLAPGFTLLEWLQLGHPELGRPTIGDLRTHLSTIFTEVRARGGVLEIRAVDAQMRPWWIVPAVITAGILYDDDARSHAIELLRPFAGRLELLWRSAADSGLKDAELGDSAFKLADIALTAARRDPRFAPGAIAVTEKFVDRFTQRGLCPGDELRPLLFGPTVEYRKPAEPS